MPATTAPSHGALHLPWAGNSVITETYSHCTPLDAPWDDLRASLDNVPVSAEGSLPMKVDVEMKKKNGRKVGRGKIELVGRSHVSLNSK
jgi:hypothetical protein